MNTQLATRQFRIKQWSEIIHARIESGQTINEYSGLFSITSPAIGNRHSG